ncbi:YfcC family protein [Ureibacillus aquaedulcis]|uniref:AbgT family transporter n=1 Tax=Ureibacillus aquaedulcis TaxID=3058421 RepID=A0ABT8GMG3_9BACL|nr:Na+/H+ antiporter NhaC family protein [Ureibacillus sp. BA0131]MDN4492608.1 AbgT family transporter [Ureibacillus sp. BA0131]
MEKEALIVSAKELKKKKKIEMPDVFVILFIFMVLSYAFSFIIPSGSYERIEKGGITQIDPESFSYIQSEPLSIMQLFSSIAEGLSSSADIIFLILVVGGTIALIDASGALKAGINSLVNATKGNYLLLITVFAGIFAVLSSLGIGGNLAIAFVPIGIIIARSLNLDPLAAVAIVFLGSYAGLAAGVFDPVVTVLGQTIAELPIYSGVLFRVVIFIVFVSITILYICLYAKKVRQNPAKSLIGADFSAVHGNENEEVIQNKRFSLQQKIVIVLFFLFFGTYLYGAFKLDWGLYEMSAIFIMLSIAVAVVSKISPNQFVGIFMKGANGVMYGALVVGVAKAVIIILEKGHVIDTIVSNTTAVLDQFPPGIAMQLLYVFNLLFNCIITSGSGQAAIVMPIMVPIMDMLDITRQTGFLTFKLGESVTNIITPLSGTLMACLAIGKVSFVQWFKFVLPLFLIWTLAGAFLVGIAVYIHYGPY